MIINGVERRFFMGVSAAMKIADCCPGGDIAKLNALFDGRITRDMLNVLAVSAVAMNEDYIAVKGLKADPLKRAEVLLIPPGEMLNGLLDEVIAAYRTGMATTVSAEPAKDPKNAEGAAEGNP